MRKNRFVPPMKAGRSFLWIGLLLLMCPGARAQSAGTDARPDRQLEAREAAATGPDSIPGISLERVAGQKKRVRLSRLAPTVFLQRTHVTKQVQDATAIILIILLLAVAVAIWIALRGGGLSLGWWEWLFL